MLASSCKTMQVLISWPLLYAYACCSVNSSGAFEHQYKTCPTVHVCVRMTVCTYTHKGMNTLETSTCRCDQKLACLLLAQIRHLAAQTQKLLARLPAIWRDLVSRAYSACCNTQRAAASLLNSPLNCSSSATLSTK